MKSSTGRLHPMFFRMVFNSFLSFFEDSKSAMRSTVLCQLRVLKTVDIFL